MKNIILILLCLPLLASAQNSTMTKVVDQYKGEQYQEALMSAEILRKKTRGAKLAPLDLIIASCLCLTGDQERKGIRALDQMINNYRLSPEMEKLINDLRRNCQNPIDEESFSFDMLAAGKLHEGTEFIERSIGGSGKDFSGQLDAYESERIITLSNLNDNTDNQIATVDTYDEVFERAQKDEAKLYFDNMYAPFSISRSALSEYFIIYSSSSKHETATLETLGARLDKLVEAYAEKFDLEIPDKLISIHLGNMPDDVIEQSMKLYGFSNETGNIGYSSINNFSVLAFVDGSPLKYPGTIYHELMHILLNYNAPFLPPWLAEGLPALYEASSNQGLTGVHNWRGYSILTNYKSSQVPSDLFEMNWNDFDGIFEDRNWLKMDAAKKSLNHATARYFVFYLQEEGKLEEVVKAFVNYHYGDPSFDLYDSNEALLEATTQKDMDQLWDGYIDWMVKARYLKDKPVRSSPPADVPFKKG